MVKICQRCKRERAHYGRGHCKSCYNYVFQQEVSKRWRMKNADAILERDRAYRARDPKKYYKAKSASVKRNAAKNGYWPSAKYIPGRSLVTKNGLTGSVVDVAYYSHGGANRCNRKVPVLVDVSGEVVHFWTNEIARVY